MAQEMRLKELNYGDFICYIFDNMDDYRFLACSYVIDGLQNNDKVLFVIDEYPKELLIDDLIKEDINVEQYINSGQLVISSNKNIYSSNYSFDINETIENWKEKLRSVEKEGFSGFRAVGEMLFAADGCQETIEKLMEYELRVHREMLGVNDKQLNLCVFNKAKFSPTVLGDMIEKHSVIIHNREIIKPNPYYLDTIQTAKLHSRRLELRSKFKLDPGCYNYNSNSDANAKHKDIEVLKHVLSVTGEGAWELSFDTRQIELSHNFYNILKYDDAQHIHTYNDFLNLIHRDDVEVFQQELQQFCESKKEYLVNQIRIRDNNNDWIWFLMKGVPIVRDTTNGKVLKVVGMFNDISYIKKIERDNIVKKEIEIENYEKIRMQQQLIIQTETEKRQALEEAMKLKDEFLYLITHEFRTPIAIVNSALQAIDLLYKNEVTNNIGKHLNTIKQNTNRQLRLVNNLLDITKLNSGAIKLSLNMFDINYVTQSIVSSVEVYAKQKGIHISFTSDFPNKDILMDEEKYERILLNLLANALKFTSKGKHIDVCIGVNAYNEQDMICVSVRDEGIGIPADKLETIFERFGQADTSLSRQAEGTGLGLHLVKLLVVTLNGEIMVESEVNKGSTFTVLFPIIKSAAASDVAASLEANEQLHIEHQRLTQALSIEFSDIYF